MNVTLSSVKINKRLSEETTCFTANVLLDGQKVGEASNRGHGDPIFVMWTDAEIGKKIEEYAESLPARECFGMVLKCDLEFLIGGLVADYETMQIWKRQCKRNTLIILKSTPKDSYEMIKTAYSKEVRIMIQQVHGDNLVEIINDRFA